MTDDKRRPGYLWAVVQEWMDSMPYPPSQRRLAQRLGVSATTVTDWKYGQGWPSPEHVKDLADELGVSRERIIDAILKDKGYRDPPREQSGEVRGA